MPQDATAQEPAITATGSATAVDRTAHGGGASTDSEDGWHKTACILCENNCGIQVQLDRRRLAKIRGDKEHVHTHGYTCNKALRLDHYQNGGVRLTTPLRREADGSYREIGWDTALAEIGAKLKAIRDQHGGPSIFFYGGGGQGNHLGGAYRGPLQHILGSRYRSNPLAQEKCGEAWVDAHLAGGHTVGDFEHAEVSVFIGKNPWQSHGVARARTVLKQISKDPTRTMIVIDPIRSETADLADIHLQVRPGTDAWCLAAIVGAIVQDDLIDHEFASAHLTDDRQILATLRAVDIAAYARTCGIEEGVLRAVAVRIATATSVSTYEDLGVQQGPNSTVVSYLNKLTWLLTGNFAKQGAMNVHSSLAAIGSYETELRRTPVSGALMPAGLVPCNVIAEEILTDHPHRFRAMMIDSANPAHSLADSKRFRASLAELELVVVVDVALTETGRLADYVLPAASQFEKWETTFFNFEFPVNSFQLRKPLLDPLPGTMPEAEIYSRLYEEIAGVPRRRLAVLRTAARLGRRPYFAAFAAMAALDKTVMSKAAYLLYRTLGPTLPEGAAQAAALWGLSLKLFRTHPDAAKRAGHHTFNDLFDAIITNRSGVDFTRDGYDASWRYGNRNNQKISLDIPPVIEALAQLPQTPATHTSTEYPVIVVAGQRRSFTANTIIRDNSWRKNGSTGALRVNPEDAHAWGLDEGGRARIYTRRGTAEATVEIDDRLQRGHAALPNGFGLDLPATQSDGVGSADGRPLIDSDLGTQRIGVALNELTDSALRDAFAGNPWHKHVPARIEKSATSLNKPGPAEPSRS
ncbi:molybdopterin-dependent oxidoreductase [Humibacillus xanthopallidus]|uniref:Anaerobic selenocysteine-containing dehydrogenase n=1 Tax=Humibacillus xanthopallidus TaxID=412689 RepID=A0A543HHW1_9MICO|nr:molybdopterin-dependent oxidoreductase [Humibacillus xanthopallidus]TQM57867.1 anaerobic selenocysteine-containing dehydrogenase [Humibacillus xanthopallidus]